jgi:hypothetical protein
MWIKLGQHIRCARRNTLIAFRPRFVTHQPRRIHSVADEQVRASMRTEETRPL